MMRIDILYCDGCPNHPPTVALLHDVVRGLGIDAIIREIEVKDAADAERLRFLGSPTVQVDGRDIDSTVQDRADYSLSCRMYGPSGVPARALVEQALQREARRPTDKLSSA